MLAVLTETQAGFFFFMFTSYFDSISTCLVPDVFSVYRFIISMWGLIITELKRVVLFIHS